MALDYKTTDLFNFTLRDGKTRAFAIPSTDNRTEETAGSSTTAVSSLDKTDNNVFSFEDPPPSSDMRREEDRLKTFAKWPLSFIQPQDLAKSGFYYLGRSDEVRCAFCKVEIMRWEQGDDPASDHRRWAPQCPLVRNFPSGNVAMTTFTSDAAGRDECGARTVRPPGPVNPRYASESARLSSFKDWPRSMRQKPEDLAEAGFYYTGQGDKTKCFYCDGGLKDWEDDDVPWEQHARWFERCAYVQLVKGKEYVQKVVTEHKSLVKSAEQQGNVENGDAKIEMPNSTPAQSTSSTENTEEKKDSNNLDDSKLCKICFVEERNVCFIPCGHVIACAKCALAASKCPMCRRTLQSVVRLYYS